MRAHPCTLDRLGEEDDRCGGIACRTDVDIDHLTEVVNCAEYIAGCPTYFDVCFVNRPLCPRSVPIRACCLPIERRETLDPVEHGRWVDLDTALCQQLGNTGIRQPIVEVPSDGERDDVVGKAIPGKSRSRTLGLAPVLATCPIRPDSRPPPASILYPILAKGLSQL
jgi:hypothetical protein